MKAYEKVAFGARHGIVDGIHLVDWLQNTKPLAGQDPEIFQRHQPTHLFYISGKPVRLETRFLQFTLSAAELLRAAERKINEDIVDAIAGLRSSLAVIKTGDDVERVRRGLASVLKSLNQLMLDKESQTSRTVAECAERLDELLTLLRPVLLSGTQTTE